MSTRIVDLDVVPVAFPDPPLLNSTGVHEPLALRSVLRLHTDGGAVGLGEGWGDARVLAGLRAAAEAVRGLDLFDLATVERAVLQATSAAAPPVPMLVLSAIEVACLDAQGRTLGLPVTDLLGGRWRDRVEMAGYLFCKWASHPGEDPDDWGEALTPAAVVEQAQRMVDELGVRSFKLKAGVLPPGDEAATIEALVEAFPGSPLRIDPNCAWTVDTAVAVAERLSGLLEYLEDPVLTLEGMAEVRRRTGAVLATNTFVVSTPTIAPAWRADAVQVVLGDHHYWGGLRRTQALGHCCEALGLGLSMHSNSHLGISLAAMVHVAAAVPVLTYACDTHYPWNREHDVVERDLRWSGGAVEVPTGPGLGVRLDEDALARGHELFVRAGRTVRDDVGYRRRHEPGFDPRLPRW